MIEYHDANDALDLRIAEALSRWTGKTVEGHSFTQTGKGVAGLRLLMEMSAGSEGTLRRTLRDGVNVFSYICRSAIDDRTVEGIGESANLAICDAFLSCDPDHFAGAADASALAQPQPQRPSR
jgi:hypothetical protein